jgi:DNA polymerase
MAVKAVAGRTVVLDVETKSRIDLRKAGAWRYAADPSTDVWCVAFAVDDDPVELWLSGDPVPTAILDCAADPDALFVAHNAGFERAISKHILEPRYGWPGIPIERWRCTMGAALALALPAKLGKVAEVLELEHRKADDGIMHQMAKPRPPRKGEDPAGVYWFDDAARLQKLYDYCIRDTQCERAAYRWLPPLSPSEQTLWALDQCINDRGFYTDGALIEKAIAIVTAAGDAVQAELIEITGGEVETSNQVARLMAYLAAHGCALPNSQQETLTEALQRTDLAPEARRVIELRLEAAHASANKFQAMRAWRCPDGRIRGSFKFYGAATGRWSASGPQPQNLKKETKDIALKLDAVMSGDLGTVRQLGSPIEVVGDVTRAGICAPPGSKLLVADYSAIESRTLAYIADERSKLALWAKFDRTQDPGDEPYVVIGRSLGYPEESARSRGKVADLAFGYGGGLGAYKNFAPEGDTASDAQIESFKQAWRARHPQTVQFWHGIERAAIEAIHRAPEPVTYGRFTLRCERLHDIPFLFIVLPSGRSLAYPFVRLIRNERAAVAVSFMDNAIGKWTEYRPRQGAWGGTFTENLTQAVARDLIAAAMTRLEAAGYPVVLHVHDAIVCEVRDGA